jgi:hypothetical protein
MDRPAGVGHVEFHRTNLVGVCGNQVVETIRCASGADHSLTHGRGRLGERSPRNAAEREAAE